MLANKVRDDCNNLASVRKGKQKARILVILFRSRQRMLAHQLSQLESFLALPLTKLGRLNLEDILRSKENWKRFKKLGKQVWKST